MLAAVPTTGRPMLREAPFDILADLDTPVSAFRKLKPFKPRFLLESVVIRDGGQQPARYSFIGFGEAMEVRLTTATLTVDGETTPVPETPEALLDLLRATLARAPRPRPEVPGLPLPGGLVGATAYDFVRRLERIRVPESESPEELGAWVAPTSILVFDHVSHRAAVLHDGTEEARMALRARVIEALRGPLPPSPSGGHLGAATPTIDRTSYVEAVHQVKEYIAAGDVYQLVLSLRLEGETDIDPFEVYRALRLLNPSPYLYYCEIGDTRVVGSSPEALVRLSGRTATLRPIAGTRPRGQTAAEDRAYRDDLLGDAKENAEHIMLVDLARNDLGRVAVPGTVTVDPYRSIENYSHVMHIVSGVQGILPPEVDAFDLFAATFPAGTVVGAPKIRAMEIIDRLEPARRGLYAGTVGYFGHGGAMDQAIAIRTAVFRDGRYAVQAGAGIVADSNPEAEYQECLNKAAALRAALELAAGGL